MSEYLLHAESESSLEQLRAHLMKAHERVWSLPSFPESLRPDVGEIASLYKIGRPTEIQKELVIHPAIPLPLRDNLLTAKQMDDRSIEEQGKIARFDPDSGRTVFHPILFNIEALLKRTVYHEAAHSITDRTQRLTPSQYSSWESEMVKNALEYLGVSDAIPFHSTFINKMGFRKILMADGYALVDIMPLEILRLNEVFPIGFEIITDQVVREHGSLEEFESVLRSGKVKLDSYEDYPLFAARFLDLSRMSDWRLILSSFISGEFEDVDSHFSQMFGNRGSTYLTQLLEAMIVDEETISFLNQFSSIRL